MKKIFTLLIAIISYSACKPQQILLFAETFENDTTGSSLVLNFGGPSNNQGYNQWVINNQYNGAPLYANTPPQDSTVNGGVIYLAPHSHYLHISDSVAAVSGISNANWNALSASDRFCYLNAPFCSAGLTDVTFTFFWTCQGDSNAYGQVYYSADGGPWMQTGQPKYYNQDKWIYETIQDTAFNNKQSLQFGFRWVNAQTSDSSNVSFSVDDIIAVGDYDSIGNATTMSVILASPDTVCQLDNLFFSLQLSQALCDGEYEIQMSDALGSFNQPYNLGTYGDLPGGYTNYTYLQTLSVPANATGNDFRIRVIRLTPPMITSDTSTAFTIQHCPNTIFNTFAPVFTDTDTACVLSAVDVFFNSNGTFSSNNVYYAELSDSNGSFSNAYTLGNLLSSQSFPTFPQGDIAGLIPVGLPPGCGYYVRVRSSNPVTIGSPIGPFCIKHCDVLTNNAADIHLCINSSTYPGCASVHIQPHYWGSGSQYDTCNNWVVELLDMENLTVVNDGFFGEIHDSTGGYFNICAPSTADSVAFLPQPLSYYLRIKSTCSTEPWNEAGSLVRFTLGALPAAPPDITVSDSFACNEQGSVISLYLDQFNYPAYNYYWSSNLLNNGIPFLWYYNPLTVTLNPQVTKGVYTFYVQEENNGCYGVISAPATVTVTGLPIDTITGPSFVCPRDTPVYNVGFQRKTYYQWTVSSGAQILDPSNVQTRLIFDTTGTFILTCRSIDSCGEYTTTDTIEAVPCEMHAIAFHDTVFKDQPDTLQVEDCEMGVRFISSGSNGGSSSAGGMFSIAAHDNIRIDSFAVKFTSSGSADTHIYGKKGSFVGYEENPASWTDLQETPVAAIADSWTTIPGELGIALLPGDTFAFYVTSASNQNTLYFTQGRGTVDGTLYKSDSSLDFMQGTRNTYPYGTVVMPFVLNTQIYYTQLGPFSFVWSTGDTGRTIYTESGTPGENIYQVIAKGRNGQNKSAAVPVFVLDSTTGIQNIPSFDNELTIIPNPTSGIANIKTWAPVKQVDIYDAEGRKIYGGRGMEKTIDISQFAAGMYVAKVTTGNGIYEKKIILIK